MSDRPDTPKKSTELPDDVGVLKSIIGEQEMRIAVLEEQLRLAIHRRHGASSEKADPDQPSLFTEKVWI